ncbi:MAG: phosphoribosylaminoimidazolesuccinocarboxamide synthase [Chloroflexi bacterium]|nr:phosphoribosylaminoimidazolesuccinocarboxamide synthase [Chloroflexota bacterium]
MNPVLDTAIFQLVHRGKVRDTYVSADLGRGLLLMVATDRISAFDVVLPTMIQDKGRVLTALSYFWFRQTTPIVPNHLVYYPAGEALARLGRIERLSEKAREILVRLSPDVACQSMVVLKAQRIDIECVVRGYLAGSAWAEYQGQGTVQGQPMPRGLREGERLPELLFTPTTKAETGHDQPMTEGQVVAMLGEPLARRVRETSLAVYRFAHEYARTRGIIIADTKMEFGLLDGNLILIDELLTPDSSRFWDAEGYAPGKSQPNFDKQFVRDWLIQSGWNREPPAPHLPPDVVEKTRLRYLEAYRRLTGQQLP